MDPASPPTAHDDRSQGGFTLLEILVVLTILALLMAIAIATMSAATRNAQAQAVTEAAVRYDSAIRNFRRDHGNRVPVQGSSDWPVAVEGPVAVTRRPYLRSGVPETVAREQVRIGGDEQAATGSRGAIIYEQVSRTEYRIRVMMLRHGELYERCRLGNADGMTPNC